MLSREYCFIHRSPPTDFAPRVRGWKCFRSIQDMSFSLTVAGREQGERQTVPDETVIDLETRI